MALYHLARRRSPVLILVAALSFFLLLTKLHPPTAVTIIHPLSKTPPVCSSDFSTPYTATHTFSKSESYNTTLAIARTSDESVHWLPQHLPAAIYTVDQPKHPFVIPANKGHEAMVYLSYILDHYDKLPDISIFLHAHLSAWHNSAELQLRADAMIQELRPDWVIKRGYVNLRCRHFPGCPKGYLDTQAVWYDKTKEQQQLYRQVWRELFPESECVPRYLASPCCAQFAVSKEMIKRVPKERYERWRQWLVNTELSDSLSGRVFEYLWAYIWEGQAESCVDAGLCNCGLYGLCFGGKEKVADYAKMGDRAKKINEKLREMNVEQDWWEMGWRKVWLSPWAKRRRAQMKRLGKEVDELWQKMETIRGEARERGKDENLRVKEAGL